APAAPGCARQPVSQPGARLRLAILLIAPAAALHTMGPMDKRKFIIALRIILGVATIAALIRQFGSMGGEVVNFFSYFTHLTNIILVFVYLSGAWTLLQNRKPTVKQEMLRGGSVVFILVVGLVYEALLRRSLGSALTWNNLVVHYINPVMALLDWLIYPP